MPVFVRMDVGTKMKLEITISTLAIHDTIISGLGRIRDWAEVLKWSVPELCSSDLTR